MLVTDEDRALLAEIRAAQKAQAESLREARDQLQIMSGGYRRQLDRLTEIEAQLTRIETLVGGAHQSKEREPTVSAEAPLQVTADDIERALERET